MYSKNEYVLTSLNAPYEDPTKNNSKKKTEEKMKNIFKYWIWKKKFEQIYWEEISTIFFTKSDVPQQLGKDRIKTTTTLSYKKYHLLQLFNQL